MIPFWGS